MPTCRWIQTRRLTSCIVVLVINIGFVGDGFYVCEPRLRVR